MKVITHSDIANLKIPPETCFEWVRYMIENKDTVLLPKKISMKLGEGIFCNVMPSVVTMPDGKRFGGVKMVSRFPQRVPALDSKLILFDADSGENLALMDADWITAMRTGAVAVHSLNLLAKKDYKSVGFIGLGNTARATALVMSKVCKKNITVNLLKYKGQEQLFAERFENCKNFKFNFVDTPEKLVGASDVIISAATYLPDDLCGDETYKKGVTVIPIHTLGFTNCDLFFDKVFADDVNHVNHFKYFDKFRRFAEVSEVVGGKAEGRANSEERILVYNIGVASHDVYFAANVFKALENEKLQTVDLCSPKEKFWI